MFKIRLTHTFSLLYLIVLLEFYVISDSANYLLYIFYFALFILFYTVKMNTFCFYIDIFYIEFDVLLLLHCNFPGRDH